MAIDKTKQNRQRFDEARKIFRSVLEQVETNVAARKKALEDHSIRVLDDGFPSWKEFVKNMESVAISEAAEEHGKSVAVTRGIWRVLSMPTPIYDLLESGRISLSRAKLALPVAFDAFDDKSIASAEKLAGIMDSGSSNDAVKAAVAEESKNVWNQATATMDCIVRDLASRQEAVAV